MQLSEDFFEMYIYLFDTISSEAHVSYPRKKWDSRKNHHLRPIYLMYSKL